MALERTATGGESLNGRMDDTISCSIKGRLYYHLLLFFFCSNFVFLKGAMT